MVERSAAQTCRLKAITDMGAHAHLLHALAVKFKLQNVELKWRGAPHTWTNKRLACNAGLQQALLTQARAALKDPEADLGAHAHAVSRKEQSWRTLGDPPLQTRRQAAGSLSVPV